MVGDSYPACLAEGRREPRGSDPDGEVVLPVDSGESWDDYFAGACSFLRAAGLKKEVAINDKPALRRI